MYKKVNLSGIIISEPKSVKKNRIKESINNVVPKYYQVLTDKNLKIKKDNNNCWFCKQQLNSFTHYFIKTLYGDDIGFFCSKICRDSFANMIKGVIALREEPKVSLLPLEVYENPEEVIEIINELREKEGTYGNCILETDNNIRLTLRCHCSNNIE
ncbi:late transcription factor VLTF-2 [Canarypox virus]|uniref:Viral late gene transcription factor 2 n=4 Tax=Avipoxvirus TaxID=10260 RepID=A0A1V0QG23_CNPV|nr:late transcription factor VLTF-2 [Canarypox virus]ARE67287.1 SWPV2-ORF065 [Shearwaterpox virus]QRM15700.1 late transcription factor vltf-2 [Penguinpox virus 2]QRM16031.1 late transcription factor vltf-2 [Albatrosspox virus]UOX38661.1 late transcription factor VLTF-2 [Finch poxvirus]UWX11201.1 CRPV-092 [Crowpox virus]